MGTKDVIIGTKFPPGSHILYGFWFAKRDSPNDQWYNQDES